MKNGLRSTPLAALGGLLVLLGSALPLPAQKAAAPGPVTSYQKLLRQLGVAGRQQPATPALEKVLRTWFVRRSPENHLALQQYVRRGKDRRCLQILLGFLATDLEGILAGGGVNERDGKLFLGYLEPLVERHGQADRALAALALRAILAIPAAERRQRLGRILDDPRHPLVGRVLALAGGLRDLQLAPHLAPYLGHERFGAGAGVALRCLTFRSFPSRPEFDTWWKANRSLTWETVRDRYVDRCLRREEGYEQEKREYARRRVGEAEAFYHPYIRKLVASRLAAGLWNEPLDLLKVERTRLVVLRAFLESAGPLTQLPTGEQEKHCLAFLEEVLTLAESPDLGLNGLLLESLGRLANLPPARASLRSRALAALADKAGSGPVAVRLKAVDLVGVFRGGAADRTLLELLCAGRERGPLLARLLVLLKSRSLDLKQADRLEPTLKRVRTRLTRLLMDPGTPKEMRSDAIHSVSRWLPDPAVSFLSAILLGKEGLGSKVEDREAAAVALQDTLLRQKSRSPVVARVVAILLEGLRLPDAKGRPLARVRSSCATGLGRDQLAGFKDPMVLVKGLGEALQRERDTGTVKEIINSLSRLGVRAGRKAGSPVPAGVRGYLLKRVAVSAPGQPGQAERGRLATDLNRLSPGLPAKAAAAQAFARVGDRTNALAFFSSLIAERKAKGSLAALFASRGAKAPRAEAQLLRDYLTVLLFGRTADKVVQGTAPLRLTGAELEESYATLRILVGMRDAGALEPWGRREEEWRLHLSWHLALARREEGKDGKAFFREAAAVIQELLARPELTPTEKVACRLQLARAQMEGGDLKAAQATVDALTQEGVAGAVPLRARVLERQKQFFKAAVAWKEAAKTAPKGTPRVWDFRLNEVQCYLKAGKPKEAGALLQDYLAKEKPGTGSAAWQALHKRLEQVKRQLPGG